MTHPRILPQSARRLRDEPIDTAISITEQFGPRRATSLAEAQTAAYLDGRLRRAGLKVSADGFDAPAWAGWDGAALAGWMLLCVLLYRWQPVLAILCGLVGSSLAWYFLQRNGEPFFIKRRASQNIIATRALAQKPNQRIVLLAPLDTPPLLASVVRPFYDGQRAALTRLSACLLILLLAFVGTLIGALWLRLGCWYLQFAPLAMLLGMAGIDLWLRQKPVSIGAVSHAGALATLLGCAEELLAAEQIELWVVALGASESGSGLRDLLRRYPFEPSRTQFIALESIGSGELAYLTRVGLIQSLPSDANLLARAASADTNDRRIDTTPRPLRHAPTTLGSLRQSGWQAIGISCIGEDGRPALRASANDTAAALNATTIERAVRLVCALVRAVDAG